MTDRRKSLLDELRPLGYSPGFMALCEIYGEAGEIAYELQKEIVRLRDERDSTAKEFKLTLEANAGLRAEVARLEAETGSLRETINDMRALNAQLSADAAARLMEMRACVADLQYFSEREGGPDRFASLCKARAALAPRPPGGKGE